MLKKKTLAWEAIDFIKDLLIIGLVVLFIRSFVVMPFQISWQSMYDSYYDKEFIIVDRFSYLDLPYRKWTPKRWDVVVFKPQVDKNKEFFIKRVIWLPWETIKIEEGKVYLMNNKNKEFTEINELYLSEVSLGKTYIRGEKSKHTYIIPEGSYFVMWDNRSHSTDSRTCFSSCSLRSNYIKKEDITWKVLLDLWYFNFKNLSFIHPDLAIDTHPKLLDSQSRYSY